nr:class I SAM-dependent methyltransferase [Mycolicibacterium malmesburyense]
MNRIKIVQRILDERTDPVYLEIGVGFGVALRRISADQKIAVDPAFRLSSRYRGQAEAKARATHYFETASDSFFETESAFLGERPIDVALIDGLHTYKQVVRDVENTLRFLKDDGVIVLHDCNPARAMIACPATSYADFCAQSRWRKILGRVMYLPWSGDVWKAIVHLRSTRDDLRIAVLDCDFGVGLIRRGLPESRLSYSSAEIEALSFKDLAADRARLLNLKSPESLDEFLGQSAEIP